MLISKLEKLSEYTNSGVEELFSDAADLMAQAGTAVEKVELDYLMELVEICIGWEVSYFSSRISYILMKGNILLDK